MKKEAKENFEKMRARITLDDLKDLLKKESKVMRLVKEYLPGFYDDVKTMYSLVKDYTRGEYREIPWWTIAAIGAALLYILNPFDIIPDFIPGVGYIDDAFVVSMCLKMVKKDLEKYREWKRRNTIDIEDVLSLVGEILRGLSNK